MELIADLHVHTVASVHAMGTVNEMLNTARGLGMKALAITDHAPGMVGTTHRYYFTNLLNVPRVLSDGFLLLRGVEANIMDEDGHLDMTPDMLKKLDWVIASMHKVVVPPMSYEDATNAWLRISQNPDVDMIGHAEQREYLFDYARVTKAFADCNKVVELNGASVYSRPGNEDNMYRLAKCCLENRVHVAVTSDAHSTYVMGKTGHITRILEELDYPSELVINASLDNLICELKLHGMDINL